MDHKPTGRISELKKRCETICGKSLDPQFHKEDNAWELRYVNHAGVHHFSIWIRHTGNRWRISAVTSVLMTGRILEANSLESPKSE